MIRQAIPIDYLVVDYVSSLPNRLPPQHHKWTPEADFHKNRSDTINQMLREMSLKFEKSMFIPQQYMRRK